MQAKMRKQNITLLPEYNHGAIFMPEWHVSSPVDQFPPIWGPTMHTISHAQHSLLSSTARSCVPLSTGSSYIQSPSMKPLSPFDRCSQIQNNLPKLEHLSKSSVCPPFHFHFFPFKFLTFRIHPNLLSEACEVPETMAIVPLLVLLSLLPYSWLNQKQTPYSLILSIEGPEQGHLPGSPLSPA